MTLLLRDRLEGDLVIEVAFTGSSLDVGDRAEPSTRAAALAAVAAETAATPVLMRQVHGRAVAVVDGPQDPVAPLPEADALVTTSRGLGLVVLVADCVPVLLAARRSDAVAVVPIRMVRFSIGGAPGSTSVFTVSTFHLIAVMLPGVMPAAISLET